MRLREVVASSVLLSLISWNAGSSAAAATPQNDCQTFGSEVSVLIDKERASPNIASARAVFQRGIMNCMEGDSDEANKLYLEAKRLLANASSPPPVNPPPTLHPAPTEA